jgi:hypothetical protein
MTTVNIPVGLQLIKLTSYISLHLLPLPEIINLDLWLVHSYVLHTMASVEIFVKNVQITPSYSPPVGLFTTILCIQNA